MTTNKGRRRSSRGRGGRGRRTVEAPVRLGGKRPPGYTCKTEARQSTIPGAGLGLFMLEEAKAGDRVAVYTGTPLTAAEAAHSTSPYLFQVNKNLVLDAQDPTHANGRYINDGAVAGREVNARFGAARFAVTCKETGRPYVSVRATRTIPAGTEVLASYGRGYWGKSGFNRDGTLAKLQPGEPRPPGAAMISATPTKEGRPDSAPTMRAAPVLRVWRNPAVREHSRTPGIRTASAPQRIARVRSHTPSPSAADSPSREAECQSAAAGMPLRRH